MVNLLSLASISHQPFQTRIVNSARSLVLFCQTSLRKHDQMATQNIDPGTSSGRLKDVEGVGTKSKDNHSVSKRLQKELMTLMMSGDKGVSAFPDGDNLFKWVGTIDGAESTVYAGLKYKLILDFPSSYPYSAPTVKFETPCYHPNVDQHGNICLDILKEKWSALYDVRTILLSIQSLLGEPNNNSPLNVAAAELWPDQEAYKKVLLARYQQDVLSKKQS